MTGLDSLWLPIVVSAVVVFVVSSLIHMLTPWHKSDYRRLPKEAEVMDALRPFALPPGDYMVPCASSREDFASPEFADRLKSGPVFMATVLPSGPMSMAGSLMGWFVYCLVVGLFGAYLAGRALGPGAHDLAVVRFVGAATFAGYSLALWQQSIWFKRAWGTTIRSTLDGLLYALLTGGVFAWLWPR